MKNRVFPALTRHVTLLRTFSVLSLLILTVIAALLAWRLQGVVERIALKQEATLAQGQAEALLRAHLLPRSASAGLTPKILRGLAAYTQHNMHYGLFVRVKIWSPNGTILYSDARSAIGKHFPIDDDLADILSGTKDSVAHISDLGDPENVTEHGHFRHLLEVYLPIRVGHGRATRVVGA